MSKTKDYNPGKIKPLIQIVARLIQEKPERADRLDLLIAKVEAEIPELRNKKRCANCDANMVENIYIFDILDAALLMAMASEVQEATIEGVEFTDANKIHVPTLETSDAIRHRTTKSAKLGLVAKYINEKGKHEKGMWVITRRGWATLRGENIPGSVKVWRNKIVDRMDNETSMYAVIHLHQDKIEAAIAKGKDIDPDKDYRKSMALYNADEWVHFGETQKGRLGL